MAWIPAGNLKGSPGRFLVSDVPPAGAVAGDAWFDSTSGAVSVLYDDGDSAQWVGVSGAPGRDGDPGAQGADGAPGAQGPQGDKGDTGAPGNPATATISLSNNAASSSLPTGTTTVSSFAQAVRNCLRWLTERFDTNGIALDSNKWAGANKTISTSAPSGGANGDIWFQREA